jgi:hypothetical protein
VFGFTAKNIYVEDWLGRDNLSAALYWISISMRITPDVTVVLAVWLLLASLDFWLRNEKYSFWIETLLSLLTDLPAEVLTALTKSASAILLICTEYFGWEVNSSVYSGCPGLEYWFQDLSSWRSIL